jgi:hypothetical protein
VYRFYLFDAHRCLLMIVNDFNIVCIPLVPPKADPPLIVDTNAILPLTLAV